MYDHLERHFARFSTKSMFWMVLFNLTYVDFKFFFLDMYLSYINHNHKIFSTILYTPYDLIIGSKHFNLCNYPASKLHKPMDGLPDDVHKIGSWFKDSCLFSADQGVYESMNLRFTVAWLKMLFKIQVNVYFRT